ncbi:MAG: hypothetical protein KY445_09655 [Armatimonadetes bacterium]|nr:hypothetical protein [Armatimonadota bacterium]
MPTPNDIFINVEKQVTQTEQVGITLKELSLVIATPDTAGVLALVLAPKDAAGNFRSDVAPVVVRKVDNRESDPEEGPAIPQSERFAASILHNLILSAIVADTPTHQAMGIVGMTVRDAAKAILNTELPVVPSA